MVDQSKIGLMPAFDMLLAAAQAVVNEGLDAAEEHMHLCDKNDEARKAAQMPAPLQALYHAVRAANEVLPSVKEVESDAALHNAGLQMQYVHDLNWALRNGGAWYSFENYKKHKNQRLATLLALPVVNQEGPSNA